MAGDENRDRSFPLKLDTGELGVKLDRDADIVKRIDVSLRKFQSAHSVRARRICQSTPTAAFRLVPHFRGQGVQSIALHCTILNVCHVCIHAIAQYVLKAKGPKVVAYCKQKNKST